jgi:hypothetical protein
MAVLECIAEASASEVSAATDVTATHGFAEVSAAHAATATEAVAASGNGGGHWGGVAAAKNRVAKQDAFENESIAHRGNRLTDRVGRAWLRTARDHS